MRKTLQPVVNHDPGKILAKAAFRAAEALGMTQSDLSTALGISPSSTSRMRDGSFDLSGKPFELATCLVRVFRSLDAIVAGDDQSMKTWMNSENLDLGAIPREYVQTAAGLIDTMNYLDANRAPI